MRSDVRSRLTALAMITAGFACGSGTTEPPLPVCSGQVTLGFSAGPTPTISWTPVCGVEDLVVLEPLPPSLGLAQPTERWSIHAGRRLIEPPVRYGQAPRGTVVDVAAAALEAGKPYGVGVSVGGVFVGFGHFTP
jgi:hypothetical protein